MRKNVPVLKLTERERNVALLIAKGFDQKEICEELCFAYSTLRTHLNSIYGKFHLYDSEICHGARWVKIALKVLNNELEDYNND